MKEFKQLSMQVQLFLYGNGYYTGAIDGILGKETKTSIASYQKKNGMVVTGSLSDELVKKLIQ